MRTRDVVLVCILVAALCAAVFVVSPSVDVSVLPPTVAAQDDGGPTDLGSGMTRFIDREMGVVCYRWMRWDTWNGVNGVMASGLSCLPMEDK